MLTLFKEWLTKLARQTARSLTTGGAKTDLYLPPIVDLPIEYANLNRLTGSWFDKLSRSVYGYHNAIQTVTV